MKGFSQLNTEMALEIDAINTADRGMPFTPTKYLQHTCREHLDLVDRSIDRWRPLPQERRNLDEIIGRSGASRNCLASNHRLRMSVGNKFINLSKQLQLESPKRQFSLVTLVSDPWLILDRDPYVRLKAMRQTIHPVMALAEWDGWFGIIEFQTLSETVSGLGRVVMAHVHVMAWTERRSFYPERAQALMSDQKRIWTANGIPAVDVREIVDATPERVAAYMAKASSVAKRRLPDKNYASGFKLMPCALAPISAVRQTEILSGMYMDELMISGGEGCRIRTELVKHMLMRFDRGYMSTEIALGFWERLRTRAGRDDYFPVFIDREQGRAPATGLSTTHERFSRGGVV